MTSRRSDADAVADAADPETFQLQMEMATAAETRQLRPTDLWSAWAEGDTDAAAVAAQVVTRVH